MTGPAVRRDAAKPVSIRWSPADLYADALGPVVRIEPAKPAAPRSEWRDPALIPWLDALDGVAWLADAAQEVVAVGGTRSAAETDPRSLFGQAPLGREAEAYRRALHLSVLSGRREAFSFHHRRDSPSLMRTQRTSLSRIDLPDRAPMVLYQAQTLEEVARPRLALLDPARLIGDASPGPSRPMASMCAFCQRFAWPRGRACRGRSPAAGDLPQARRSAEASVAQGVCRDCRATIGTAASRPARRRALSGRGSSA